METDFLRLILFFVGIVVVLMIYFWERHKRINAQVDAIRNAEERVDKMREEFDEEKWVVMEEYQDDANTDIEEHREYNGPDGYDEYEEDRLDDVADSDNLSRELDQLSELVAEESTCRMDKVEQMPLFANDELEEPPLANNTETKVLVINLASKRAGFSGAEIIEAAAEIGLELGEMDIFHRYQENQGGKKRIVFNMASMVEPGSFPLGNMESFVTPGLSLFVQISNGKRGLALYDEMLLAAKQLAKRLDGELQDETHCTLTRQAIEFQRAEIMEYQRRQMLLKNNK